MKDKYIDLRYRFLQQSIAAGICIGLGGYAQLQYGSGFIGALLFSVGLLTIISSHYKLYTGTVCNKPDTGEEPIRDIILWIFDIISILLGNEIGVAIIAILANQSTSLGPMAIGLVEFKMAKSVTQLIAAGIICEFFIAAAVKSRNVVVTVLAVVGFIICGSEHCVADLFYILTAWIGGKQWSFEMYQVFLYALAGNTIGGLVSMWIL